MRANDFLKLLAEASLFEINMGAKNLRRAVQDIDALAGMEFEMIVPNIEVDVEPEWEPDMDQDQRARSFRDVRDFFHDGDYNGRRAVDDLMEELTNEYEDWMQEKTAESWESEGVDYMRDFIEVNDLFDRDEALDQARDEVMTANPDLPQESEDFQKLVSARIDELQEQFVLEAYEDQGRVYNDAFETFAEEQREEYDERSFLDDRYQTMSDIQSNFDISWPHYYDINDGQNGDVDIDQVADEFSSFMGKPVNASQRYHGARREAGHYVVEPDGSLEGDNPGDSGLEFVSPPMPVKDLLADLAKVKRWADKTGAYTNDSTGLHINISVPNYSIDKLDYTKLAILMGDEYVLELFGRTGNTYAKSAMDKIKTALKTKPESAAEIMKLMKKGLDGFATKAIHSGITEKYTSINTKTGYIEFRSPGGDWLDTKFDKIENTLMRFTVALNAAIDPEAYRKEYLTKLYKLLSNDMEKNDSDIIQLFSNYSAGDLDKAALIRQVRQKQLARNVAKGKATGKMWWKVSNPANSFSSIELVASSKEEAIDIAVQPGNYPDWARVKNTLRATPLRPYEEKPKGPSLNGRPSNPDGNYVIVSQQDESAPVYRFMASGDQDAISVLRQWIAANPGLYRWTFKKDAEQTLGQPGASAQPAADNQGDWGIWLDGAERFVRIPRGEDGGDGQALRRFSSQAAAKAFLERTREENPRMRTDISIREIPADYQWPPADTQEPQEYEIFDRDTGATVDTFTASTDGEVARSLNNYRTMGPHRLTPAEAQQRFGLRRAGSTPIRRQPAFQEPNAGRGDLTPRGPGPWEIYRISDNSSVRELGNTDRTAAGEEARRALGLRGEAPELYGVRTRPGRQEWTGEWLVLDPNGRELHRFSGIGNVQADANRHAMNWLRAHPGAMQAGVTVVPEMQ